MRGCPIILVLFLGAPSSSGFSTAPTCQICARKLRPVRSPAAARASLATTAAPAIGACLANGMFFSGVPELRQKEREGTLGDFNPFPMPVTLGNCIGWTVYSLLTRNPYIAAANVPGMLLSCWMVLVSCRLADERTARRIQMLTVSLAAVHAAAGLACAFYLPTRSAMISLYGLVCNGILLAYYASPLSTIRTVIRERKADSIYFPTVLLNAINAAFWSAYALAIHDKYVLIPNAIGGVLCSVQLLLRVVFGKAQQLRGMVVPSQSQDAPDDATATVASS